MPRRADEQPRIVGPTQIKLRGATCWRVTAITPGAKDPKLRRVAKHYRDIDEANREAEKLRRVIERTRTLSIESAIEAYQQHLYEKGTGAKSYAETVRRLRAFFPDLAAALGSINAERAAEIYDAFRQRLRPDGEPISVDYHRSTLINARSMYRWCIKQKWVTANPFAEVEGVGRRNAGKEQHTGNETRRLYDYCMARAQAGDKAALGVLMALLMALRSGDITRRIVRDVDLDGTVLRVWDGKTKKSNRPRKIPAVLQPMLWQLAAGRHAFEPLFKTPYREDGHHTRRWLEQAMERFCEAAGVPYVCPHALKGTAGSLLAETGAAADVIADHLSHEDGATTKRHYMAPGAAEEAQAARALEVIAGGRR
jgi:integrase